MDEEQNTWKYTGAAAENSSTPVPVQDPISWTASEYVAHEKSANWYVILIAGTLLFTGIVYWLNRDILTALAILTIGICAAVLAGRKPAAKSYRLTSQGLYVDERMYSYTGFSSFSVVEEGAIDSIWLKPIGRFAPFLVIYFAPEDEDNIIAMLSNFLPHQQRELDVIDQLMKRLRF